jgi:hypothetical protein
MGTGMQLMIMGPSPQPYPPPGVLVVEIWPPLPIVWSTGIFVRKPVMHSVLKLIFNN